MNRSRRLLCVNFTISGLKSSYLICLLLLENMVNSYNYSSMKTHETVSNDTSILNAVFLVNVWLNIGNE